MEYFGREFGKLGFGLMRLPGVEKEIDIEETKKMVDAYMAAGFNYFDTAWAYKGSEEAIRQALVERYPRDSYFIVTKIAPWVKCSSKEEMEQQFEDSLKALGLEYVDMLLVHNVGGKRTGLIESYGAWEYVKKQKELGRTKHIGFSTHAPLDEIEDYIKGHEGIEMVQLQINYADWNEPGYCEREIYDMVRSYGLPIVVMEPIKGGLLANPPKSAMAVLEEAVPGRTPADWALRFPADLDGVITVLSGMSSLEQMEQNIATLKGFAGLSDEEKAALDRAQKAMRELGLIPCTGCNYCSKVCPENIGISGSFAALNALKQYEDVAVAAWQLGALVSFNGFVMPTECIECGACEDACPQNISIRDELKRVAEEILPFMAQRPKVYMK